MVIKITFPHDVRCLLKTGEKVEFGQPFLEKKEEKQIEIFVAKELGIQSKKIFRYLKKFVGDTVSKNEVIALKKNFFTEKKILSPLSGIIKEIDHDQGMVLFTVNEKDKKIVSAYFQGEVVKVKDGLLELAVNKANEYSVKKLEIGFGGRVYYLSEKDSSQLSTNMISNKIIVAKTVSSLVQSKIEALGSKGLVVSVQPDDLPSTFFAVLKNSVDFKKILKDNFSYCYIDQLSSKIFFYE